MPRKTAASSTDNRKRKEATIAPPPFVAAQAGGVKTFQTASLEEQIRCRAYELYLERNGSPGDEHQDWLLAEREIRARYQQGQVA